MKSRPSTPKPGYSDYIMKLKPGERYFDDNQWIGITALDVYKRTHKDASLGKLVYEFMTNECDSVLGGGIYWKETSESQKHLFKRPEGPL